MDWNTSKSMCRTGQRLAEEFSNYFYSCNIYIKKSVKLVRKLLFSEAPEELFQD